MKGRPMERDRRLEALARDVGAVLEQHGYPSLKSADRQEMVALVARLVASPPPVRA
jgi:hypothetical protein